MSISISSSFLKSPSALSAEEHPLLAVKIMPSATSGSARRTFHLALLLDVSGSMEGPRLEAVKMTMRLLLDSLQDGDILTLISYESVANVLARATTLDAVSRPVLRANVDSLHADGGTNLQAALAALREVTAVTTATSVATVTAVTTAAPVDGVFILTDGHINQGLMSASGLTRLLTAAIPGGTPVYTLGFGADHNSRMLRDMALRTRGSYTYADAAELIPATIADIISGLSTEVGRRARISFPPGWTCMELSADEGATEFTVGTLVADKEQWVVLRGPPGPLAEIPAVNLIWRAPTEVDDRTKILTRFADFDRILVAEQFCRCRVATIQTEVQDLLETHQIAEAREKLIALGAELDVSTAKDRAFVISLRAQVDEMIEVLAEVAPMQRAGGFGWAAGPALAPVLSRMASNTAALGTQAGVMSHISSVDPSALGTPAPRRYGAGNRATPSGVTHTFSSPSQRSATNTMRARYSQMATPSAAAAEEDEVAAFDAAALAAAAADPITPPRS